MWQQILILRAEVVEEVINNNCAFKTPNIHRLLVITADIVEVTLCIIYMLISNNNNACFYWDLK